jgi:hypothetical protein
MAGGKEMAVVLKRPTWPWLNYVSKRAEIVILAQRCSCFCEVGNENSAADFWFYLRFNGVKENLAI